MVKLASVLLAMAIACYPISIICLTDDSIVDGKGFAWERPGKVHWRRALSAA
jgi:hypothetical protein